VYRRKGKGEEMIVESLFSGPIILSEKNGS
jgi:hypothetical protein